MKFWIGLALAGIATAALLAAMSPAEDRMKGTGGPGMIPFELSGGQDRADEILSEWGEEGEDAAREQIWIDFAFLLAYGTFLTLALLGVRALLARQGRRRLVAIGGVAVFFGAFAAGFDALENVCLLLTLDGAGAAFPLLATIFASCKFALLAASLAYLAVGLATSLATRVALRA